MKKIININMAGRVVPIDEGAYENLQRYLESLRKYFANEEGRDEIINDIESRVAELMSDKIKRGVPAIGEQDVQDIINSMGRVEDFEEVEADETHAFQQKASAENQSGSQRHTSRGRLYRNSDDKFIGGVCSGIASYLNVDPAIVRLLFAIITFGGFGSGIIIYLFLWIILPETPLEHSLSKRLFRNPDDKMIAGVAGGLGAYFHRSPFMFRVVFAAPLLINILVGFLHAVFGRHGEFFPNVFVGSFTATFLVIYVVLWVLLPEANTEFEKMEMRGETIDVNRIRQNVRNTMDNIEGRVKAWGNEFRQTAEQWRDKTADFTATQGKDWFNDSRRASKTAVRSAGHVIGVLFKAFFIFVSGCVVLALLGALMTLIFGGLASWKLTSFLFTSNWQQLLAWSTVILFIMIPLIALITWLVRRMVGVKSRNRYLAWTFSGLWTMGWIAAICLAASVKQDLSRYEKVEQELTISHPIDSVLNISVNELPIHYSGDLNWIMDDGETGWDVADDQIRYNNVRVRYSKSDDSAYHITVKKFSAGRTVSDAEQRAAATLFPVELHGDNLQLPAGLTILRAQKFRGQGVIVELEIPVGKKVRFDRSLDLAYDGWVVRKYNPYYTGHGRKGDWNSSESVDVAFDKEYVMKDNGSLEKADKPAKEMKTLSDHEKEQDSLENEIRNRREMDQRDQQKLEDLRRRIREERQSSLRMKTEFDLYALKTANPFFFLFG